tara:strand:+ start:1696 stop:1926 length:231 start_codon:yes stop_codon:yes gene_type:complete
MREFIIKVMVSSQLTEEVSARVEASSLKEAIELFKSDPNGYDWYGWEEWDRDVKSWDLLEDSCYDPLNQAFKLKAT